MFKPMSTLSAHDFTQAQGALGITARELALALGRHQASISAYKSGRSPIPNEVAIKLQELLQHEVRKISEISNMTQAAITIGSMITFQNTRKKPALHTTEARFMRRQLPVSTSTLPAYRLTHRQWQCYVSALEQWFVHVKGSMKLYQADGQRKRDYELELADIKALASGAPRALPYDVVLQINEWDVVSRALRHCAVTNPYAYSLYQTWRKNRGAGSYLNYRAKQIEARLASKTQS